MIRKETTPLTAGCRLALGAHVAASFREAVHEQTNVDDLDIYYSMVPKNKMVALQVDLRRLIGYSCTSFHLLCRKTLKKGLPLNLWHYNFFKALDAISKVPSRVQLEPGMFRDVLAAGSPHSRSGNRAGFLGIGDGRPAYDAAISPQTEQDRDNDPRGYLEGYYVNRFTVWLYKTLDVLAVRHGLPLATNLLRAYPLSRSWLDTVYRQYMLTKFGTSGDPIWQAVERGELIIERGYTREILGNYGDARRKSYDEPTLSTTRDGLWYENNVDGSFVKTTTYKMAKEMGDEAFGQEYPFLMPPQRGAVMLYNAKNCNYNFNWHPKLLIGEVLTLVREGQMEQGNIKQWTIANILGRIEKATRKQRELRARLEAHTYDLIEHCIGMVAGYNVIQTAMSHGDRSKGELFTVPLTARHDAKAIALLLSSTTQYLKFCLGGAGTNNDGYVPMVDVSKIESVEALAQMRLPDEGSVGASYLRKITAGRSVIVLFFHKLRNDVILPVGALEIDNMNGAGYFGQFKGHRNGKIPDMYRSAIRQGLNTFAGRFSGDLIDSGHSELRSQGLRYNPRTKVFNFIN